jgi:hypothetical protein
MKKKKMKIILKLQFYFFLMKVFEFLENYLLEVSVILVVLYVKIYELNFFLPVLFPIILMLFIANDDDDKR